MSEQVTIINDSGNLRDLESKIKDTFRGEGPTDVEQKCLKLCKSYLGGIWSTLNVDDIQVRRLTGGLSNQVYHCIALDKTPIESKEDREVIVRFYGTKFDWSLSGDNDRLNEILVSLFASQNDLGPKVLGLFEGGQIQKYYPNRNLAGTDLNDPGMLEQLATKLARFHAMSPPLPKDYDYISLFLTASVKKLQELPEKWKKTFEKHNCPTLLKCDMSSEVKWMLALIPSFNSPLVLSHNDFRFANLMLTNDNKIVVGDHETSSYYYRGIDFASLFENFEDNHQNNTIVMKFITHYIKEGQKIFGKSYSEDDNNSVDNIVIEIKRFSLLYKLLLANFFLQNEFWEMPIDEKTYMTLANNSLDKYLTARLTTSPCLPMILLDLGSETWVLDCGWQGTRRF